jgi:hypothetical protein
MEMKRKPKEEMSKVDQLQREIITSKKKTEQDEVAEAIGGRDETLKDKKLRDLLKKNKELTVALQDERNKYPFTLTLIDGVQAFPGGSAAWQSEGRDRTQK